MLNWFKTHFGLRRTLHEQAVKLKRREAILLETRDHIKFMHDQIVELSARLTLANERAAIMDRVMGGDSDTIARLQLERAKLQERIGELTKGTPGNGEAND